MFACSRKGKKEWRNLLTPGVMRTWWISLFHARAALRLRLFSRPFPVLSRAHPVVFALAITRVPFSVHFTRTILHVQHS